VAKNFLKQPQINADQTPVFKMKDEITSPDGVILINQ